jgi:hypothetical protein
MNNQSEILEMKYNGFPSDDLSVDNAQIINNSDNISLNTLLNDYRILLDPRFQNQVTLAVRFGKKHIIREAYKAPLCLYPYIGI